MRLTIAKSGTRKVEREGGLGFDVGWVFETGGEGVRAAGGPHVYVSIFSQEKICSRPPTYSPSAALSTVIVLPLRAKKNRGAGAGLGL